MSDDSPRADEFGAALARLRALAERMGPAGGRLPPEDELARRLGAPPRWVGRALEVLEVEGRARRGPGGEWRAQARPPRTAVLDATAALLEARLRLEPELAALAAQRAGPDDLRRMNRLSARIVSAPELRAQELWNAALHRMIAETAGNPHLLAAFDGLEAVWRADPAWAEARRLRLERLGDAPLETVDHGPLMDAIASRDPEQAGMAMRQHLLLVAGVVERAMAEGRRTASGPGER
ncbi:MAG: FadR/GntR family transcriptional regulator [Pseudomonadota bacterium]